jgi:hypothetical protein
VGNDVGGRPEARKNTKIPQVGKVNNYRIFHQTVLPVVSRVQMKSWAEQPLEKLRRLEQCKV